MELQAFWKDHPAVAIAFSGGVDSSLLLWSALEAGARVRAYFVRSEFQPDFELEDARQIVEHLGADWTVLELRVLEAQDIAANGPERCYLCKRRLLSAIWERAQADGLSLLADGTNASDNEQDRPGARALQELGVVSPLRLCGIGKAEVRVLAKEAGLPNWDKPAYACLATRFPVGMLLSAGELRRVERAERFLTSLGFSGFRVRRRPGGAKLQLPAEQLARAAALHGEICQALGPELGEILLDLAPRPSEVLPEPPLEHDRVCQLECNLDDLTGEEAAFAVEQLLEAGALDVWTAPVTMKKGRPALLLSCLCRPEDEPPLTALLLRHTTTLGVRRALYERTKLSRTEARHGLLRIKVSTGGGVRREKPEFEDLARLAREQGLSLWEVRAHYGL